MRRRNTAACVILVCLALVLVVATVVLIVRTLSSPSRNAESSAGQAGVAATVSPTMSLTLEPTSEPTPEPTAEPTPEPTPEPATQAPQPYDPAVPEQTSRAPADYFRDAAFLGNSVVTGLDIYDFDDALDGAAFYAANSMTVLNAGDYVNQMSGQTFGKIYIGLGLNEASYDQATVRSAFGDLVARLRDEHPGAILYLMSSTPVSAYKSANSSEFTHDLVVSLNAMLYEIAQENGIYYLDVFTALSDADGYLPSDVTSDGVHFSAEHYQLWFDYLETHYIPADGGTSAENG